MTLNTIARVAHEALRAYGESRGERRLVPYADAPDEQRDAAMRAVKARLANAAPSPAGDVEAALVDAVVAALRPALPR